MKCVRLSALTLLLFLGVTGLMGGIPMILGQFWPRWSFMPVSLLHDSPFHSYLFPGIILLVANGLLPLWIYVRVKRSRPLHGLWAAFQGCVLLGWLAVECWMLRLVAWPHLLYAAIALLLIGLGFQLNRRAVSGMAQG